jgi:hypothetical protein
MTRLLVLSLALLPLACFKADDVGGEEAAEGSEVTGNEVTGNDVDTNAEVPDVTDSNGEAPDVTDSNGESAEPLCGNEIIEDGEACDGPNVGAANCLMSASHEKGEVTCTSQCTLNVSNCYTCSDGNIDGPEVCDGGNLGGYGCGDLGYVSGTLACSDTCLEFDPAGCMAAPSCGDGTIDVGEQCEGADLGGQTCEGLGFTGGTLACTGGCGYDTSGCTTCGNEVLEPGEECDTWDFGGDSCFNHGWDGGELFCSGACQVLTDGCCNWPQCGQLP